MAERDVLGAIVARKRLEIARRRRRARPFSLPPAEAARTRHQATVAALRRRDAPLPRVIAEIKHRSPSAGLIRERRPGGVAALARAYATAGAAAVSVLADGPGFGGTPLDVRRAAASIEAPVLFKGFVLDPVQLDLAASLGARLVLLLVRCLDDAALVALVRGAEARGLVPVVEAADAEELARAVATGARVVGVNARDLRSFRVDPELARRCLEATPDDRVAVYMSGVRSAEDLRRVAGGRADAVLVGEGLMRAEDPGARLSAWLHDA